MQKFRKFLSCKCDKFVAISFSSNRSCRCSGARDNVLIYSSNCEHFARFSLATWAGRVFGILWKSFFRYIPGRFLQTRPPGVANGLVLYVLIHHTLQLSGVRVILTCVSETVFTPRLFDHSPLILQGALKVHLSALFCPVFLPNLP